MEHLASFGLKRDPFQNEPQLGLYLDAGPYQEAGRRLLRAVGQGKGLTLLTGAGGVGKTMLVRHVLESLEEEVYAACLLVPVPGVTDGPWLLSRFARHLGVEEPAEAAADLLGQIYEALAVVREDGRHTVLLLDEAQVLEQAGLLPELRGILNLEYEEKRLVSMVLVGLPSLAEAVAQEPALADRVDARITLAPLDDAGSREYLAHRIRLAEGNPAILESAALAALVKHGGGIPRRLNTLADNALFEAHLAGRHAANAADVERAAAELSTGGEPALAPAKRPVAAAGSAAADRAATRAEPRRAAPAPPKDLDALFADETAELELDEVVAAETDPPQRSAAAATVAMLPDPPKRRAGAEATVAFLDEPPARRGAEATVALFEETAPPRRGGAAETVAFLPDSPGESELDDLFADLVDD